MVNTKFIPAMAEDLQKYSAIPEMAGDRKAIYTQVMTDCKNLKAAMAKMPEDLKEEAKYLCNIIKPQMGNLRKQVDAAEGLMSNYPFPTYEQLISNYPFPTYE